METEQLPLPKGASEFIECKAAYSRCIWMGMGRGWIDPVAEKQIDEYMRFHFAGAFDSVPQEVRTKRVKSIHRKLKRTGE
jgi:capsid protein